jgi:pimeloyl-ACP methyl ester carboxylesterase
MSKRRAVLFAIPILICCAATAQTPAGRPPIVFVHGNGDDAAKWIPVIWLFESNGYARDRLFAIRFTDPAARADDRVAEPFRSSTTDQASELSAFVTRVLIETKAPKVVLVGSSRGGLTIRNYLKNAGGAAVVSHAVLCGTPNHGVMLLKANLGNEFNGNGYFVRELNGGSEVVPGVQFLTLRSDKLDKYAQPGGAGYEGPALEGAVNIVLPGLDHREVAFHPRAFAEMYRFITGQAPSQLEIAPEERPVVSGVVTGFAGQTPTNRPLAGVRLRVFALEAGSARRTGAPILDITTSESGAWGPLTLDSRQRYEFALERDGRSVSYFHSPVLRSTALLNLRFMPERDGQSGGLQVFVARPQGYLSRGRDPVKLDGDETTQVPEGLPATDSVMMSVPESKRSGVRVELRGETIYARPVKSGAHELSVAEFFQE